MAARGAGPGRAAGHTGTGTHTYTYTHATPILLLQRRRRVSRGGRASFFDPACATVPAPSGCLRRQVAARMPGARRGCVPVRSRQPCALWAGLPTARQAVPGDTYGSRDRGLRDVPSSETCRRDICRRRRLWNGARLPAARSVRPRARTAAWAACARGRGRAASGVVYTRRGDAHMSGNAVGAERAGARVRAPSARAAAASGAGKGAVCALRRRVRASHLTRCGRAARRCTRPCSAAAAAAAATAAARA